MPMGRLGLICVAGGGSSRLPGNEPKPFRLLAGRPVFQHALDRFAHREDLAEIILVVPADRVESLQATAEGWRPGRVPGRVVAGGEHRTDSVRHGLAALSPDVDVVAIHDAARPLTPPEAVDAAIAAARQYGAAVVATPVRDTLKRSTADDRVAGTVPREALWQAQTPQVFRRELIDRAYAAAPEAPVTDDAALVEALGEPVVLVDGTALNLKITYPEDLALAEALLQTRPGPSTSSGQAGRG